MRWSSLIAVLLAATAAVAVAANAGTELVPAVIEDSPLPSSSAVLLEEGRRLTGDEEKLWKELVPEGSDQDTEDNIECGQGLDELTDGETLRAVYLLASKVLIETKTTAESTRITEKSKNAKAEWVMNKLPKTLLRLLVPLAELLASKRLTAEERKHAVELALTDKTPIIDKKDYDVHNKATTSLIYGQLIATIFRLYKREMDHDLSQERLAKLKQEKSQSRKNLEKEAYNEWVLKNNQEQTQKKEYNLVKEQWQAAKLVLHNAETAHYPSGLFKANPEKAKRNAVTKAQNELTKAEKQWNDIKKNKPPGPLPPFEVPKHSTDTYDTIKTNVEYVAQKFDQLFLGITKTPFELPSIEKEPAQPIFKSLTEFTPRAPSKHAVNCKSLEMVIEDASNRLDENDDKMNKFVDIAKAALKVTNFVVTAVVKAGASASPAGPAGGALAGAAAGAVMDVIENVGSKVLEQDAAVRTLRRSVRRAMLATFKGYVGAHIKRHQIRVRKQLLTKVLKDAIEKAEESKTKINPHELKRELRDQIKDVEIDDPDCTSAMRNVVRDILTMLHPGSDIKIVQLIEQCASKSKEEAKEFLNPSTFSRLLPALQVISDKAGFDMSAIKPIEPVNPTEVVTEFITSGGKEVFDAGMDYYKELLDDKEAEEDKEKQLDALNEINSSIKDIGEPTVAKTD